MGGIQPTVPSGLGTGRRRRQDGDAAFPSRTFQFAFSGWRIVHRRAEQDFRASVRTTAFGPLTTFRASFFPRTTTIDPRRLAHRRLRCGSPAGCCIRPRGWTFRRSWAALHFSCHSPLLAPFSVLAGSAGGQICRWSTTRCVRWIRGFQNQNRLFKNRSSPAAPCVVCRAAERSIRTDPNTSRVRSMQAVGWEPYG